MQFKPLDGLKTVADSGTPEALGTSALRLYSIQFIGEKARGTNNTGNVTIQTKDADDNWVDSYVLTPGAVIDWIIPPNAMGYFTADQFKIKVATNNDGVHYLYTQRA